MVEQLEKMPSHAFLDGKIVPWNKANIHYRLIAYITARVAMKA